MNKYALEAAEYADSQRLAYALARGFKGEDEKRSGLILNGLPYRKVAQVAVILAHLASLEISEDRLDRLVAASLAAEASGGFEKWFESLG